MEFVPLHLEPHTAWRPAERGAKTSVSVSNRPKRHVPGRAAWRGLSALLARADAEGNQTSGALRALGERYEVLGDYPLDVLLVGYAYGNQSAVVEDVFAEKIPMPVAALSESNEEVAYQLEQIVDLAEQLRRLINDLDRDIRRASGGEPVPWDKGQHPGDPLMARLTSPTMRLLAGLRREPERYAEGRAAWEAVARRETNLIAEDLLDSAPPSATVGTGERKDPFNLAKAEVFYKAKLRKLLPPPEAKEAS